MTPARRAHLAKSRLFSPRTGAQGIIEYLADYRDHGKAMLHGQTESGSIAALRHLFHPSNALGPTDLWVNLEPGTGCRGSFTLKIGGTMT